MVLFIQLNLGMYLSALLNLAPPCPYYVLPPL